MSCIPMFVDLIGCTDQADELILQQLREELLWAQIRECDLWEDLPEGAPEELIKLQDNLRNEAVSEELAYFEAHQQCEEQAEYAYDAYFSIPEIAETLQGLQWLPAERRAAWRRASAQCEVEAAATLLRIREARQRQPS